MPRDPRSMLRRAALEHRGPARRAVALADALLATDPGTERSRAVRSLLRTAAVDGTAWTLAAAAATPDDDALLVLRERMRTADEAVARAASWLRLPRRPVVTVFGPSRTVLAAIIAMEPGEVRCLDSGSGLAGRRAVARLRRAGVRARGMSDLAARRSLEDCDVAILGGRAIGPTVSTLLGGHAFAILAADAATPCYLAADELKALPDSIAQRALPPGESFPASVLSAVLTERGAVRAAGLRRLADVEIPLTSWRAAGFSGAPGAPA